MNQLKLGVNVDHVATLRQARGTVYPDPVEAARIALAAGAANITMHLREDRRHIQDHDVERFTAQPIGPLNLEMGNAPEIVKIALRLAPAEVCLVPERRAELTTEGGLDVPAHQAALKPTVEALTGAGTEVSLFVNPDRRVLDACAALGVPAVELHTGAFCDAPSAERPARLRQLMESAAHAHGLGLKVNAGHGINMETLGAILEVPHLNTLNIGHSLIARSVFLGLEGAVREMLTVMAAYQPDRS
jgi:pyridoxine 5-phosphate synthase